MSTLLSNRFWGPVFGKNDQTDYKNDHAVSKYTVYIIKWQSEGTDHTCSMQSNHAELSTLPLQNDS